MTSQVVMLPDSTRIYTEIKDGKCRYSGATVEDIRAKHPNAVFLSWDNAIALIDVNLQRKYDYVDEINEQKFDEMLNVLPPENWTQFTNLEYYMVCEAMEDRYYAWYIRKDGRYFSTIAPKSITHNDLVKKVDDYVNSQPAKVA